MIYGARTITMMGHMCKNVEEKKKEQPNCQPQPLRKYVTPEPLYHTDPFESTSRTNNTSYHIFK